MYGSINTAGPLSGLGFLLPILVAIVLSVTDRAIALVPILDDIPVGGGTKPFITQLPAVGTNSVVVDGNPLIIAGLLVLALWTLGMAVVTARRILPRHEA